MTRLGVPFKIVDGDVSPFRLEVARRIAAINSGGRPAGGRAAACGRSGAGADRGGPGVLPGEHGREPIDARELAGQIAKDSRPRTQTVAGYDLTFSPVKSVSTLWAVADPAVAAVIERAHQAAVQDALTFIEKHALFTRTGPQGIRQVNVRGLVATAFTHRDSRPATRTCTPTSRLRTRCRPSTDAGCPSTDGCYDHRWPRCSSCAISRRVCASSLRRLCQSTPRSW